jgi:polyprenyl-phospho-N-acetylgalactosaminyl synthase
LNAFRPCAVVPTYDNPHTFRRVVEGLRAALPDVVVVDDGSGPEASGVVESIHRDGLAHAVRLDVNVGKGGAVKAGLAKARRLGFSHGLQVDADGQHNLGDVSAFLDAARSNPDAMVLGYPVFDQSAPWGRLAGRQITKLLTRLETGGRQIVDPMCGFRVYPLASVDTVGCGDRMDFDIDVAVRWVWRGLPVVNLPTKVRYVPLAEGGISHFRMFEDNVLITWLHIRLLVGALWRGLTWPLRAWRR